MSSKSRFTMILAALTLGVTCVGAGAAPCTTNPLKLKKALSCLNDRLDALEGIDRSTEPVYQDDIVKVTAQASRGRTSNPAEFIGNIVLRIKNISSQTVLLKQSISTPVTITDNSAVSCASRLSSFPISRQNNAPDTYLALKPGKIAVTNTTATSCSQRFAGTQFDLSIDFLKYDEATNNAIQFTAGLTGIPAPIK
jgi:hypothetical protein